MLLLRYYLWFAPNVLAAVLLVCLLVRGLQKQLPVFTAYLVFAVSQFLASVILALRLPVGEVAYHWFVVITNGISALLVLGIIYELVNELLLSRSALAGVLRPILRGILALLVLVAAVASGAQSQISLQRVTNVFEVVDFSSSLIEAGMLLALFMATHTFQISWRSWAAGVALGFGILASINLTSAALRAVFGIRALMPTDQTQMAAFHVAVIIWFFYALRADTEPTFTGRVRQSDLELWDQEMRRIVQR